MSRTFTSHGSTQSSVQVSVRHAHVAGKHGNARHYAGICTACRAILFANVGGMRAIYTGPVEVIRSF